MKRKGQALLEAAIFGSIIVMLLGILINYGLRYNYQQKATQQAFRKSLANAVSQAGAPVSNVVVLDRHIPNPADTFGVGSVMPFTGSAGGVTRDYKQTETADTENELPRVTINVNGQEFTYKTAGFRDEQNVLGSSLARYQEIYGQGNVWVTGSGACLNEETSVDSTTGQSTTVCAAPTDAVRIIDPCAGEIMDYDTAVRQCRMIVDSAACAKECARSHYSDNTATDCSGICSEPMNVPWYCANYTQTDSVNHIYNFPALEQLFAASALKTMGLQQDYTQRTTANNTLNKAENTVGITTTDNLNWNAQTTRKIIHQPYGSADSSAPATQEVTTNVGQKENKPSENANW